MRVCLDCWSGHPDAPHIRTLVEWPHLGIADGTILRGLIFFDDTIHRIKEFDDHVVIFACGYIWTWEGLREHLRVPGVLHLTGAG